MKIYQNVTELIGKTPLIRLKRFEEEHGLSAMIFGKLESMNPAGSIKDRIAKSIIEDAEARGFIGPGAVIVESTSGNTGIGLASIAATRGYRVILTMPETMSEERRKLLAAYGAELVLTEGERGMAGANEKAEEIVKNTPNSFMPSQFENPINSETHYQTTGPEIWKDTDGKIDFLVAGVGTGGTLSGTGKYLKEQKPSLQVVAVEPATSAVLSGGEAGGHGLQGIGAGFVPAVLDTNIYDHVIPVQDEDAFAMGRSIARTDGILVGISSGAALWAAAQIAHKAEHRGKKIVVILPDTGERYLTSPMFEKI